MNFFQLGKCVNSEVDSIFVTVFRPRRMKNIWQIKCLSFESRIKYEAGIDKLYLAKC